MPVSPLRSLRRHRCRRRPPQPLPRRRPQPLPTTKNLSPTISLSCGDDSDLNSIIDSDEGLVHVPTEHTGSKIDEKILMKCGELEQDRFVLDLGLIREGPPGRTRGLSIRATENGMVDAETLS